MAEWDTAASTRHVAVTAPTRLTLTNAARLKGLIDTVVADGPPRVAVDLSGTEFVDSSGLGALVGGLKSARQAGGDLRLAGASEQVRMVLGLTNLDRVLRTYDDLEAAVDGW